MLLLAHGLAIAFGPRELKGGFWMSPALVWHDVAVGVAFWMLDRALGRPRVMWVPYLALAAYAALNVPVVWVLSSPLTVPMWRASGGALADSITYYLTPINVAAMLAVMAAAFFLPWLMKGFTAIERQSATIVMLAMAAVGPLAMARVETYGLHRNAITALIVTATPRIAARAETADWRASPVAEGAGEDLTNLRGAAVGRNVVIVALESMGAQYLAFHGAASDPTPNLTAMAAKSIIFDAAYVTYPESIKGLFALLCSRAPAFDVSTDDHARASCAPLPQILAARGFRTGLFHSGRFGYLGMQGIVDQQGFETAEDAGAIGGNVQSSFGVDEPATVERMLAWIDKDKSKPFLLTYLPVAGHHPYATTSSGPFEGATELTAYLNALAEADRALGSLLTGLRARGLIDRTLFVFAGDHGEAFGQHPGNVGHSLFLYDENVRVPLVVALPGMALPPERVKRVVSIVDVAPAVLELLDLPFRPGHEGVSLLAPRERMALFHTDYATGWLGLRDRCWKTIVEVGTRRTQLYDVCADPNETTNRAAERSSLAEAYRERLERWAAAGRAAMK
ncbi:MAG TPA: sulfatase [Vicinamibacterales bacterium]|nr:sulfatase [Vicinamibacterales bacterium]